MRLSLVNNCPRDGSRLVDQASSLHDVVRCNSCSGMWLPASAVVELIGKTKIPKQDQHSIPGEITCPDDGTQLNLVKDRGVEIDICACCGGVWLDGGELEKLKDTQSGNKATEAIVEGAVEFGFHAIPESGLPEVGSEVAESGIDVILNGIGSILSGL